MLKTFRLLIVLFAFSILACSLSTQDDRGYIVKVGDVAPDFSTKLDNGNSFKLSDYKGKVVMLQFTASWCGVCRKEMPFIESELWQVYKDKGLVIVGVDRDEPAKKMKELKDATGITYPLAFDDNADIFRNNFV